MSSRVAGKPIEVPSGVDVKIEPGMVVVKGSKGELSQAIPPAVSVTQNNGNIQISANEEFDNANALAGTIRALLNNNVQGVTTGFSKKLVLVGVGYRAKIGKTSDGAAKVDLTLGLSHDVHFVVPKGVEVTAPSSTELIVTGPCKQVVGQVAADIRGVCGGVRKPEPYKGKGIRYENEQIILKETKKK